MIEWISVKDRVPENRRQVLVCSRNVLNPLGSSSVHVDKYNPKGVFDCERVGGVASLICRRVSHWAEINHPKEVQ